MTILDSNIAIALNVAKAAKKLAKALEDVKSFPGHRRQFEPIAQKAYAEFCAAQNEFAVGSSGQLELRNF